MRCGEASLVSEAEGVAVSQRCRRWSCDHCLPLLRAKVAKRVADGRSNAFATIKAPPGLRDDPDAQIAALVRGWKRARRRPAFAAVQYFVVVEATQRGEPHLHIAIRFPFEPHSLAALERMLLDAMSAVGVVDVDLRPVHNADGLGRYMAKEPIKFAGSRRYWSSRRWASAIAKAARFVVSEVLPFSMPRAADWIRRQGIAVLSVGRHRLTFSPP